MKKRLLFLQIVFAVLFLLAFIVFIVQVLNMKDPIAKKGNMIPGNGREENFDPSLAKLNSVDLLIQYCDSIYNSNFSKYDAKDYARYYTEILTSITRDRFYHGYSYYGYRTNFFATVFSKLTYDGYRAITVPDDILKYPMAACSQQSIIMMVVLKKKGITYRKIGFKGEESGHFSFEVYYDNSWHFFDPDMEPDAALLNLYKRPDIATLVDNKELLLSAYKAYPRKLILDVFPSYFYGSVNEFPAPRGIIFQNGTKFLSYTSWLFLLLGFILVRKKYRRLVN